MNSDGFWNNQEAAKPVIAEMKLLKAVIEPLEKLDVELADVRAGFELGKEAGDQSMMDEADRALSSLEVRGESIETQSLLDGKADPYNAYVTIQSGAGGTEAQDWADMLARMYLYFWERRGWDVVEMDRQYGEQAGIKSVTFHIKGEYAFGYMRAEHGTHRLVRISPFNAQAKRQTSFASLAVEPELPGGDSKLEIPEKDLDVSIFVRASGPGGQNVNKVATACRILHIPTGMQVTTSVHKSAVQNKSLAMDLIRAKLELMEQAKRDAELKDLVGEKATADFGTQIRSYVLDDRRVKDHRTNVETSQVENVLDRGDLDPFIDAELRRRRAAKK
jgi:peptide chain release factor 2